MEEKKKKKPSATAVVKEIQRRTKRIYSAEEKIRIVLVGFRGEVTELKVQNDELKKALGKLYLEKEALKKSLNGLE